jgi:hypothetical protein
MKMRAGKILSFGVIMSLISSFSSGKFSPEHNHNVIHYINPDTSIVDRFIRVDPFNLIILPPSSGVQFYKDGIVFLSSSKSGGNIVPEHVSFGTIDARYAVIKDSVLENPIPFSSLSFPYPCDAVTFTSDFNTMYYTKVSRTNGTEKIYRANFSRGTGNQGEWSTDSDPVSFCTGNSIYSHPAISTDGKLMVFASNRPGSVGGIDLFASVEKGGNWSDPVNLGDAVNSTSNELYPFLDSENNLYFSSDGIQGFGGYDIYVCKFKGNTWEKPINLSTPINTKFDDVAFTINKKDGKSAFYAVKQNSGKSSVQLYKVSMKTGHEPLLTLSQYFTRPGVSNMVILALEPAVQATDKKPETVRLDASESNKGKDNVIYRVQFLTSFNPRTRTQITVNGKFYGVTEYLYSGAYRLCVGEFSSIGQAVELRNSLRNSDYPQASVIAFKNNVLSLDPELLKEPVVTIPPDAVQQKKITEPVTANKPTSIVSGNLNKKVPEPEVKKTETAKVTTPVTETKKAETAKPVIPEPGARKEVVVYRVQIITNTSSKGIYKITINNKIYNTFEYLYSGGYRTCVGEFSALAAAKELQNTCRQSGYPQAFVVAFKNNVRSTDPALFK